MLKTVLFAGDLALTPVGVTLADSLELIDGICSPESHMAEGPIDSDLTQRQSRFFCDAASITHYSDHKGHILVQFVEKEANHPQIVGFAGRLDDENIMKVEHVYLGAGGGKPITVSEGYCKFFVKNQKVSSIVCGMKVDETGRRTVAVIGFEARRAR
jgi:hypothetical protein